MMILKKITPVKNVLWNTFSSTAFILELFSVVLEKKNNLQVNITTEFEGVMYLKLAQLFSALKMELKL